MRPFRFRPHDPHRARPPRQRRGECPGPGVVTTAAGSRTLPPALAHVTGTVHGQTNPGYTYDANGNLAAGADRSVFHTRFNMPVSIARSGYSAAFQSGPEHQRLRQITVSETAV